MTPEASLLRHLAVPSWVMAGGIADNARFVAGQAAEVGLCFFETQACLAYEPADLPPELAALPLAWHVHLPVDLPWLEDTALAADAALRLMDKVAFLNARRAVVHLPPGLARAGASAKACRAWDYFMDCWRRSGRAAQDVLLENQIGDDPAALLDLARACGAGLCLDFSHWLLSSGPGVLPDQEFLQRVALAHINAPGRKGTGHEPLTALDPAQQAWAREALRALAPGQGRGARLAAPPPPTLMLEMFAWDKITASLPVLHGWWAAI